MTNLMCRGRKRGLAGVIATQRLAKLAKNVAAEASNFLMGRTFLDIDMARAADLLGMERRQAETIRDLERGHFLALGPALSRRPLAIRIGAVGLGAGAVAAFTRPGDTMRFFEIDPAVLAVARDSGSFSYLTKCAHGAVDYRLGDARLTLAREPAGAFDLLLIDAFSSDSVPTHLLTVEAMRSYLDKLAPGGVLLLHLTNRNLELTGPAAAVAKEVGAVSLQQLFTPTRQMGPSPEVTPSGVMMVARTEADLARFKADKRWTATNPGASRPWSDDYTNILGALIAHMGK